MKWFKDNRDESFWCDGDVDEFKKRNDRFLFSIDAPTSWLVFPYFAMKFLIVIPLKFLFVGLYKMFKRVCN